MPSLLLLAQQPAPAAGGDPFTLPMILVGMFALFWLMVLRPAQRQEQQRRKTLSALKKNDDVVTHAGILGTVVSIKEKTAGAVSDEDEIVLRIEDNGRLRILRSAVARIRPDESDPDKKSTAEAGKKS
ncbi:MAG TPA: preprotein translocase subunit YajC [Gemmatales bacterium]|nr:preprotein translocase subunit YajC [Gemmatales bacterium]HMP60763.1 preprotein translocase subunit YajC [Gemmatales bacterium]